MCGVLLVCGTHEIHQSVHQRALSKLSRRGPTFVRSRHQNNIFIAHTVLRITGTNQYYDSDSDDFLAYNGEIYNYKKFGQYSSDIELMHDAVKSDTSLLKRFEGAWAWAWTDFQSVRFASDPQGERCLYCYQDQDLLVVCSDVAPILEYVQPKQQSWMYHEKHWALYHRTPWQDIYRIRPGIIHDISGPVKILDSIFDWPQESHIKNMDQAWEEFVPLWSRIIKDMTPECAHGVTASGGIDSSVIFNALPQAQHLYAVNCVGKDLISPRVSGMMTDSERSKLVTITMDAPQWAAKYIELVTQTKMPVQSWSFVGQWAIAQHCQEPVLFTGVGADELFGGYPAYATMIYQQNHSASAYSRFDPNDQDAAAQWQNCLVACSGDCRSATLLMDFLTQVSAVDMRGVDTLTMMHGIEPRSPFTHPGVIKFALGLPWHLRLGKPLIRRLFHQRWANEFAYAKQGFAGHCNDSLPWLDVTVPDADRNLQWKNITLAAWHKHASLDI